MMNDAADMSFRPGLVQQWPTAVVRAGAGFTMALGLIVLAAWHAHWPTLVQLRPSFAPMQYNTALCFLCAGAALLLINLPARRLAAALAFIVTLAGFLTLAQYAFAVDFRIDQLFFRPYIFTRTSHPGRMSPVTASAFSLSGLALITAAGFLRHNWRRWLIGLLSSLVLALSSMAILGYIIGLPNAYGWGQLTQMALHTASGFLALGVGLIASAWGEEFATTNRSPRWLPVCTGLTALSVSLLLWHALAVRERAETERTIRANAAAVKNEIVARLDSRIRSLGRMARRWEFAGSPSREVWEADASAYIADDSGYQGVAWVDPEFRVRWIVPLAANAAAVGRDLGGEERRRLALAMARDGRHARFTHRLEFITGGAGIMAVVPIFREGRFEGFIVGGIRLQEMLDATLGKDLAAGYAIALAEGGKTIYERPGGPKPPWPEWVVELPISLPGVDWTVQVWPGAELLAAHRSRYTQAVLILGALASVLLGLSVYLAQGAIDRSHLTAATNRELQHEIAERRRAQQAVQQLGELQQAIVSHAAYAVISTTPQGIITSFNPAAERMLGYHAGDVVGKVTPAVLHDAGEIAERAGVLSAELGEKIEPGFEVLVIKARRNLPDQHEWTYRRKDGTRFPVTVDVTTLRDQAGHITGFLGIAGDVSELKRAEAELKTSHEELLQVSREAGMAEVATSVLHNVGNVLNSVNVSATLVADHVLHSKAANVTKLALLFDDHKADLAGFLTADPRGQMIPAYLGTLAESLTAEHKAIIEELEHLRKNVEHIKDIVAMQQAYAKTSGVIETIAVLDLLEDALRINTGTLARPNVDITRDYQARPVVTTDKYKVMQILINLVRNARYACDESGRTDTQITVRTTSDERGVKIAIIDNGVGIPAENLTRIFNHGFTTRKEGHGFGLHSDALAARELGGSLNAHSDGPGRGATFILELPYKLDPVP